LPPYNREEYKELPITQPETKKRGKMKFYNHQYQYYCGIDLHARKMYVCILGQKGKPMVHENIKTDPELFLNCSPPIWKTSSWVLNAYSAGTGFQICAQSIRFLLFSGMHYI